MSREQGWLRQRKERRLRIVIIEHLLGSYGVSQNRGLREREEGSWDS